MYKVNRNIFEVVCECDFIIYCENIRLLINLRKFLKYIKLEFLERKLVIIFIF